jgi:hypothetical protein
MSLGCVPSPKSAVCGFRLRATCRRRVRCSVGVASNSDTEKLWAVSRCVACGRPHLSGGCPVPRGQPRYCSCGGDPTANYRGCPKWKEARASLVRRALERGRTGITPSKPAAPKARQVQPSAEQRGLGEGWSHVVQGGQVVKAVSSPPPKPVTKPVAKAHKQPKATCPARKAKPKKAEPKVRAVPKAAVKPKKVVATGSKPVAAAPPVAQTPPNPSPLEGISDLVDQLPLGACMEMTRRLLMAFPSLPKGATRTRAVLKLVIRFVAEYGSTP